MIEDLIQRIFKIRNSAHIAHWKTDNGEQHRALGAFYEDVIPKLDALVEARQGMFELIKSPEPKDLVQQLEDDVLWIGKNRAKIAGDIPALENMVDDLTSTYLSTLYKLKHLR